MHTFQNLWISQQFIQTEGKGGTRCFKTGGEKTARKCNQNNLKNSLSLQSNSSQISHIKAWAAISFNDNFFWSSSPLISVFHSSSKWTDPLLRSWIKSWKKSFRVMLFRSRWSRFCFTTDIIKSSTSGSTDLMRNNDINFGWTKLISPRVIFQKLGSNSLRPHTLNSLFVSLIAFISMPKATET